MAKKIKRLSVSNLKECPEDWPEDPSEFEAGWWIKDPNNDTYPYVGPWDTRRELDESGVKKGLENFWRYYA